jgi:predicted phage terminase large subunit-like protein
MTASFDPRLLDVALRQDFGAFVVRVVQTVAPHDQYRHNWHIDAITYQLLQVKFGRSRRLVINQPPRSLKSIVTSVAFVAWCTGHDPSMRFACASYSNELAKELALHFRAVISSPWYRRLFPNVRFVKETETEHLTSQGGGRYSVSVGGSFTGRGADIIIIDDPMKAGDALSENARRTVNEWYRGTLLSRVNNKLTGAIILVMQRLHEDDLAGMLLMEGGWHHLDLPAIAQEDQRIEIGPDAWHDRKTGDVLHPEREPLHILEEQRHSQGSLRFSAQYLQRPVPVGGNLIRRQWLGWYDHMPRGEAGAQIVQSWDIASTMDERSDWSVCTTWLIVKREYYLVHVWRGRQEFPKLRRKLIDLAIEYKPHQILIETAGPGLHMVQELCANPTAGVPVPRGIQPEGNKLVRMEAQAARFESGQIHLPREAPWLGELLNELMAFPGSRHDDQVDSISQFLNWAEDRHRFKRTVSLVGPIIVRA